MKCPKFQVHEQFEYVTELAGCTKEHQAGVNTSLNNSRKWKNDKFMHRKSFGLKPVTHIFLTPHDEVLLDKLLVA
jgi:hypothetical protein